MKIYHIIRDNYTGETRRAEFKDVRMIRRLQSDGVLRYQITQVLVRGAA